MKIFRRHLALGAIILFALALRLVRLDFQPLWWDEGYSFFFATRDFAEMLARTAVDIHPPLYYALLQLWLSIAGKSDVSARLLSVLIGVATIPLLYALARKLFGNSRVALIAAFVLALSPFHIYYSQEVRMYGLVTLLGLASVYLCARLLGMIPGKPATAVTAIPYILITVAAIYTQYYGVFILGSEISLVLAIYLVTDRRSLNWRSLKSLWENPLVHWLGAWIAIAALYLPWVFYAAPKLYAYVTSKVGIEKYSPLDPITYIAQHLSAFAVGQPTQATWLAGGSIVMIALVAWAIIADVRGKTVQRFLDPWVSLSPSLLISLSLFVPLALGYGVNLIFPFHPVHGERLLLLCAPAFYILVAIGIDKLWHRRSLLGVGALALVMISSGFSLYDFYTVPRYANDDYRPLIGEIASLANPGDTFLAIYPWQIGYLEADYTGAPLNIIETPNDAWNQNPDQLQRDLDAMLKPNSRVWLPALQTQGRIVEDALDANLRPRAYSVTDNWHGTTRLEFFAVSADPASSPRSASFDENISLAWSIAGESLAAGRDIVRARLNWSGDIAADLHASLRLVDTAGNLWAQDDREIAPGVERIGLAVPLGTPPGDYDLRLTLYHTRTNRTIKPENISLAHVNVVPPAQPKITAVPSRRAIDFANGLRLLGYTAPETLQPGNPSAITLFWQTTRAIDREYSLVTQIQDARGNIFAETRTAPAHGIYPMTHWQVNEIIRDPQSITLRGDAPDGDYRIVVAMFDATTNQTSNPIAIGAVAVKGRPHYFGAPSPSNHVQLKFGDIAQLVGYDVRENDRSVRIVLYWQALTASDTSYTGFVHLVDATGTLRAQRDQIPGAGILPTTSWVKNEYLVDVYDIEIPRDAPPGEYTIRVGMYDAGNNSRLSVFDTANQLLGDHSELSTRISVP